MLETVLLLAYILGSIPFGLIITYFITGKDIRNIGSGNIGATNALRAGGKIIGVLTLILDVAKGMVAILMAKHFFPDSDEIQYACGFIAFCGHIFPVWLKFNGGKGVATALGVIAMLYPKVAAITMLSWLATFGFFRMVSLASIIGSIVAIIAAWIGLLYHNIPDAMIKGITITLICLLVVIRHKSNIIRIINQKEPKI